MKRYLLPALGFLMSPGIVQATTPQVLSVKGTIKPAACSMSLPDGSALDFGSLSPQPIPGSTDVQYSKTAMAALKVQCAGPQRFVLAFRDATPERQLVSPKSALYLYGVDDRMVDGLVEVRVSGTADGQPVTFRANVTSLAQFDDPANPMRIGDSRGAYTTVEANLDLYVYSRVRDNGMRDALAFNTSMGVDLVYL